MSNQPKPNRILVIGGVAGGASCAARLRRLLEDAEIVVFERGPDVSFANCGLPYFVGDVIQDRENLLVATPEIFRERFEIDVRVHTEVTRIDRASKTVEVLKRTSGERYQEPYDTLVLAPGAQPVRPPLPGIDLPGLFTVRNIPDTDVIRAWLDEHQPKRAVVIGGGFIGLEMAENLVHRGLHVTLIEMLPQVMGPMDAEMVATVHQALQDNGVDLHLNCAVSGFERGDSSPLMVKTKSGLTFPADLVILGIGVRPEVTLAKDAGLELGQRGGIRVDDQMRTSDPDIFAVGDAIEVRDFITGEWTAIPLAGPANRQGRLAADVIAGRDERFRGVQGTSVCGLFGITVASTGANEKTLKRAGIPYDKVYVYGSDHVTYYPGSEPIELKLLFSPDDGKVLGAQATGRSGVDKRIDVLAMAIQMGSTVYDLEQCELCYAPQFGAAKDPVNMAGFIAANHLREDSPLAYWEDYEKYKDNPPMILDVRDEDEVEQFRVPGSVHLPLGQLRNRLKELPRDREIWVHCGMGQRSYYAVRVLRHHGFQARNLTGAMKLYQALN